MRKPTLPRLPEIILTLASLAAILWLVDVRKLAEILSRTDLPVFAIAIVLYSGTMFLMTYRIKLVLSAMHEKIAYRAAFMSNAGGLLASDFTPARTGYFATPFLLQKNAGIPLEKGMMAIVSPQIVEFFLKAAGAAAAIMLIFYSFPALANSSLLLWGGVAVMLLFCALMYAALFIPSAVRCIRMLSFLPFVTQGCDFLSQLQEHRHKVASIFPQIAAISITVFALKGFEWWFFGMALGVQFSIPLHPYLIFLVLQPLISLFQFAPFPTVAGIGLSEGSAVASMALLGVSPELAVAYMFLTRAGTILSDSIGVLELVPALSKLKAAGKS